MRWFGVRLQLLLVALAVLLVAGACERSLYFCKMMDRAVAECCCAGHDAPRSEAATARAPDCCELIAASKQPVLAAHDVSPPHLSDAALAVLLPSFEYPESSFRWLERPPSLARAPPAIGPPLFISHCALLI